MNIHIKTSISIGDTYFFISGGLTTDLNVDNNYGPRIGHKT